MPQQKPNNSSLKEQLNELQSEETQGMLLHKNNNKPVITIIGKHAKEQFDKALDLAFKEQSNRPIVIETPLSNSDELIRQAELASHQLHIATNFRTEDEHKLILANQKHHKSLHNLPQGYYNTPSLTNKRDTTDGLQGNFVDDKTPHFTPTSYDIAIPKLTQEQKQLIKVYGTAGETDKSVQQNDGNLQVKNLLREVEEALSKQTDTIFTIHNPYALVEAIDEADYYKRNADTYLQEYQLIQQKQSKLSSTKRRKIVEIVEKYLLT